MRKFNEVLDQIHNTYDLLKKAEEKEKELRNKSFDILIKDIPEEKKREAKEKKQKLDLEAIKASEKKRDLQITLKILKNNAKIALFNEAMPEVLEVLKKYEGKAYGEKTREKIKEEIKEKTNCYFYISSEHTDTYNLQPVGSHTNEYNIACGSNDPKNKLLVNNKIQCYELEKISMYYMNSEYIEDIPKRIRDLKAAYKKACITQEELEKACKEFNNLVVGDIKNLYVSNKFYGYIQ